MLIRECQDDVYRIINVKSECQDYAYRIINVKSECQEDVYRLINVNQRGPDDGYRIINVKSERVKTTFTELFMLNQREARRSIHPNY